MEVQEMLFNMHIIDSIDCYGFRAIGSAVSMCTQGLFNMQMVDMTDRSHYSLSCQGGYMNTHFANTVKSPFKIQLLCILSCFLK